MRTLQRAFASRLSRDESERVSERESLRSDGRYFQKKNFRTLFA